MRRVNLTPHDVVICVDECTITLPLEPDPHGSPQSRENRCGMSSRESTPQSRWWRFDGQRLARQAASIAPRPGSPARCELREVDIDSANGFPAAPVLTQAPFLGVQLKRTRDSFS
jgi:hypothetical protein